jgi:transposase
MEPLPESANPGWPFPFTPHDWDQTPPAVQAYLRTVRNALGQLQERVDTLEARLQQNSTTSHRPPSSDSPYKKPRQRPTVTTPRKAGGKPGHLGHRQALFPPTTVQELRPERCPCGNTTFALTRPYYTHQVLELPPIAMEVTHWVLHQGWCPNCGRWSKAQVPAAHATGYGPRFSALMGEIAGAYGNGRRIVQTFCASVLHVPISLGAIQKVLDRVSQAIEPHYTAIATQTRSALVNYIDETPWFLTHTLQWLWVMVSDTAAFYMIHPRRSKEVFAALIDDWAGILVSDGYGVYQNWVARRQTCLAHLIRTARSLAERQDAELAASIMTAWMTQGGLPVACYARWTRSGCFWHSTALSRPTTAPSAPCALASSGGSGPRGRPAPRATVGWSGSCRSAKRVAYRPSLPTAYW